MCQDNGKILNALGSVYGEKSKSATMPRESQQLSFSGMESDICEITRSRRLLTLHMVIGVWISFFLVMPGAQAAEFIPLGDLPGGFFNSVANDVSDDGTVVVGIDLNGDDTEAVRWTADTGTVGLGDFPGGFFRSQAWGVSADGSVVVGRGALEGPTSEAFRWTNADGMVGLGDLSGGSFNSEATGVSANGSVVVGRGNSDSGGEAYRWTSDTGMVGLGDLSGGSFNSSAEGVSADGKVVVGWSASGSGMADAFRKTVEGSINGPGNLPGREYSSRAKDVSADVVEAFRWTEEGGMIGLGDLPGGEFSSRANDVSADGSVVVGWSTSASGMEAYRWTSEGGMIGLGDLPGGEFRSSALGISADGNVVVGDSRTAAGLEAFVWTEANGMARLHDVLVANGATGLSGWGPLRANGISSNGQWVVGRGTNPSGNREAFLARLPNSISQNFEINAAISDAWFFPPTGGQGFFIIVWEDSKLIFMSWFTYDTERPPEDVTAFLGEPGHRWLTALGPYEGDTAILDVFLSSGMIFDSADPAVDTVQMEGATIEIVWIGCNEGLVDYNIPSLGLSGDIPIQRIVLDKVAACEAAQAQ